jgi:hypothetical protein
MLRPALLVLLLLALGLAGIPATAKASEQRATAAAGATKPAKRKHPPRCVTAGRRSGSKNSRSRPKTKPSRSRRARQRRASGQRRHGARRKRCAPRARRRSPGTPPILTRPPTFPSPGGTGSCGCQADAAPAPRPAPRERPFSPTSFWNTPLGPDAQLDPASDLLVGELADQVVEYGPWINTYEYSSPVYTVGPSQPRVKVTLDTSFRPLEEAFAAVPVPPHAEPADGNDAHMVVSQPGTDTLWEFWHMARRPDGWHARWGGKMDDVSTNPGWFPSPHGATATGLPLLGGMMRIDELRRGRIDHALDISLVRTRAGAWSLPATRTDGWLTGPETIPEGARFRLDPRLRIETLDLPPVTRMIAEAAQRYGIVVRDKAGAVAFYGEDPAPTGSNPYYGPAGLYGGRNPAQLLSRFPWSRLQLLQMELRTR